MTSKKLEKTCFLELGEKRKNLVKSCLLGHLKLNFRRKKPCQKPQKIKSEKLEKTCFLELGESVKNLAKSLLFGHLKRNFCRKNPLNIKKKTL